MRKEDIILLLKGADCKTCLREQRDGCIRWWGEAVGWQWSSKDGRGFCEDFSMHPTKR